jgi:murein hydrolase activator
MRALAPGLLFALLAASAPAQQPGEPLDRALQRARAEQATAERRAAELERSAGKARNEAERLRAEQAAAAQALEAAEARITAADAELRLVSAYLEQRRLQLAREQQPVAALLAGLAVMARQPPLVALADRGSTDDFVKVRVLLDSTLPVIRRRTASLSEALREGERLQEAAVAARAELVRSRQDLAAKRERFASLEREANRLALAVSGQALSAGDVALVAGEDVERLRGSAAGARAAAALAAALRQTEPAPPRPPAPPAAVAPPLQYQLPAAADVTEGLGSVSANGVKSRGITLDTRRGAEVTAPASGIVRFSGPHSDYDGVVIIDHGRGWMSVLVNVSSQLRPGDPVRVGQPIGRALGPLHVELSQNGRRISPALIAGSSQTLSNNGKGG